MSSYDAFISYSHGADGRLAPALQRALHRFAKPWYRARAVRVFRDQTNLALTPNLPETLTVALDGAAHFLLMASPRAAQSKWVQSEASHWLAHKGADRILIVLTEGEIHWDGAAADFDWARTNALPDVLKGTFRSEPLYLDLRWTKSAESFSARDPRFVDAVARISAILRGMSLDEIAGEDVRQHRRTRRIAAAAVASIAAFAVAAAAGGLYAWRQQQVALAARDSEAAQRRLAEQERAEAVRQRAEADRQRGVADQQRDEADRQRAQAVQQRAEAERRRNEALASQSRFLAESAQALARRGDFELAAFLLLEALPRPNGEFPRPLVPEAAAAMRRVLANDPLRLVLRGHEGAVRKLAFPKGGHSIVSMDNDATLRIWNPETGGAVRRLSASDGLALSDDGRLAFLLEGGNVEVWSLIEGRLLRTLERVEDGVSAICVSPDGTRLVAWTPVGRASVWNTESGAKVASFDDGGQGTLQQRCLFSADGSRMASVWLEGFRVWNLVSGKVVGTHKGTNFGSLALLDRDGRHLVTDRNSGPEIDVWDVAAGSRRFELSGHAIGISALALDRSGVRLASGGRDNAVRVWDIARGQALALMQGHESPILHAVFSADDARLVTGGQDRTARVWDVGSGRQLASFGGHEAAVTFVALGGVPERLMSGTADGAVRVWDAKPGAPDAPDIARVLWSLPQTSQASFSPDGRFLLTADIAAPPRILDAKTLEIRATLQAEKQKLGRAVWSPSGRLVAGREHDGTIRLWRAADGAALAAMAVPDGILAMLNGAEIDRAETRMLIWSGTATGGNVISLFEVPSGQLLARQKAEFTFSGGDMVKAVAFVNQTPVYVTVDRSATMRMRSVIDGRVLASFAGHGVMPVAAWFTQDRGRLISVASDGGRVWDVAGARGLAVIALSQGELVTFSEVGVVSRDGRYLATHAHDNAPRIWNTATGRLVATLRGHASPTQTIAFSPDASLVATGASDGHVVVWQTSTGARVATIPGELSFPLRLAWGEEPGRLLRVATTQLTATLFAIGSYAGDHALDLALLEWRTTRDLGPAELKAFGLEPAETPAAPPPSCASLAGHPLDTRTRGEPAAAIIADPSAAIETCTKALAESPADPRQRYRLARALVFAERHREAAEVLAHPTLADYARAVELLASLYADGQGVARNARRAFALYEKAHALGDLQAGCGAARALLAGRGVSADRGRALVLLEETARRDSPCAHGLLAELYTNGEASEIAIDAALFHAHAAAEGWRRGGFDRQAAFTRSLRANLARRVTPAEAMSALKRLHAFGSQRP